MMRRLPMPNPLTRALHRACWVLLFGSLWLSLGITAQAPAHASTHRYAQTFTHASATSDTQASAQADAQTKAPSRHQSQSEPTESLESSVLSPKPALYFLGIGTGEFEQSKVVPALQYVDDDVRAMHAWALDQQGKIFGEVVTKVLLGSEVTRASVLDALSTFGRADQSGNPLDKDALVVVFIAGHGVVDTTDDTFYFLTYDLRSTDVRNHALAYSDMMARLTEHGGDKRSVLVLIDACQSGAVVNRTFEQTIRQPRAATERERGVSSHSLGEPLLAPAMLVSAGQKAPIRKRTPQKPIRTQTETVLPPIAPVEALPRMEVAPSLVTQERGIGEGNIAIERIRAQADPRQLWAVFSASSALQTAKEGDRYRYDWEPSDVEGHGLFTWAVLGALRTTRADLNRDGRITLQEFEKDVVLQVQNVGGQQPSFAGKSADRVLSYARGASEECDGKDNDFDGRIDEDFADRDHDGQADCLRTEQCNGVDDNGNGIVDEGFDLDNDGFLSRSLCPAGIGQDCNDRDPAISPIAQDMAERSVRWITDNNCNSTFDENDIKDRWDPNVPDFIEGHARRRRFKRDVSAGSTLALGVATGVSLGILSQVRAQIPQDLIYDVTEGDLKRVQRLSWASALLTGATCISIGLTIDFGWSDHQFRMKYFPRPESQ